MGVFLAARQDMEPRQRPAKFAVEPSASADDLLHLFERIAAHCRRTDARGVLVSVMDHPELSSRHLLAAVASLAAAGCSEGFKLAWISSDRQMFERLVHTEYPTTRTGITARTFFDEQEAFRWLVW